MNAKDKIRAALPFEEDFTPAYIANIVFPDAVKSDSAGRVYNPCAGIVARILRKLPGVIEPEPKLFWATWQIISSFIIS